MKLTTLQPTTLARVTGGCGGNRQPPPQQQQQQGYGGNPGKDSITTTVTINGVEQQSVNGAANDILNTRRV